MEESLIIAMYTALSSLALKKQTAPQSSRTSKVSRINARAVAANESVSKQRPYKGGEELFYCEGEGDGVGKKTKLVYFPVSVM